MRWTRSAPWAVAVLGVALVALVAWLTTGHTWFMQMGTPTDCPPRSPYAFCTRSQPKNLTESGMAVFSPDGGLLASAAGTQLQVVSAADGALRFERRIPDVGPLAFAPDGSALIVASENRIRVYRPDGEPLQSITIAQDTNPIQRLAISPDGELLATSSSFELSLWRLADGAHLHTLDQGKIEVRALAFSPDGRHLAVGRRYAPVTVYDVADGGEAFTLPADDVNGLAFMPDGRLLATGGYDKTVQLWRLDDRTLERTLGTHFFNVFALAISADGALLVTGSREEIKLWRLPAGELAVTLGNRDLIRSLSLSPDARLLAVAGMGSELRIWRLPR